MQIDLSIITVTFNNGQTIKKYLDTLKDNLPTKSEVIILDNNSSDSTVEIISQYKFVNLIQSNKNTGFAKGSNKAAKEAQGEYLAFINPDVEFSKGALEKLFDYIKSDPKMGIVGPKLLTGTGEEQKTVKKFPSLSGVIQEYFLDKKNSYSEYVPQSRDPIEVDCVYGAAIVIRKSLFNKLGGFDEKYFLYYEDIDLCKRIKESGYKIIYHPQVVMKHLVGASGTPVQNLRWGFRTLAHFIPMKKTGTYAYLVKSSYLYHGVINGFLIRLFLYLGQKTRR